MPVARPSESFPDLCPPQGSVIYSLGVLELRIGALSGVRVKTNSPTQLLTDRSSSLSKPTGEL